MCVLGRKPYNGTTVAAAAAMIYRRLEKIFCGGGMPYVAEISAV
jgi:hypothetical protein